MNSGQKRLARYYYQYNFSKDNVYKILKTGHKEKITRKEVREFLTEYSKQKSVKSARNDARLYYKAVGIKQKTRFAGVMFRLTNVKEFEDILEQEGSL